MVKPEARKGRDMGGALSGLLTANAIKGDSPFSTKGLLGMLSGDGKKRGGSAKHPDEKMDKALIKKMVKPEARKGKAGGGFLKDVASDFAKDETKQFLKSKLDDAMGNSAARGMSNFKKGGKAHADEKMDKALIRKMVRPEARKGKAEGGAKGLGSAAMDAAMKGRKPDYSMDDYLMAKRRDNLGDDSVSHNIAESEARRRGAFNREHGTIDLKRGGRTARKAGGKVKAKTNINIVIAAGKPAGGDDMMKPPSNIPTDNRGAGGIPVPVSMPPGGPGGMPGGGIPMPMPIPMPMAGGPPAPAGGMPMGRKTGGRVTKIAKSYKDMEAGAGSGEGRLQKTDIAKRQPKPGFEKGDNVFTGKGYPNAVPGATGGRTAKKTGGKVYRSYKDMDAGAGSGKGRLEKTEIEARKH